MFCGLLRLPFTCKHLEAYRLHEKRRGRRKSPFLSPPYPFPPFMTYSVDLLSFWSYNHIVVIYNILNTKHPEVRYGYSVLCFLFVVFIHLSGYQTIKKKKNQSLELGSPSFHRILGIYYIFVQSKRVPKSNRTRSLWCISRLASCLHHQQSSRNISPLITTLSLVHVFMRNLHIWTGLSTFMPSHFLVTNI